MAACSERAWPGWAASSWSGLGREVRRGAGAQAVQPVDVILDLDVAARDLEVPEAGGGVGRRPPSHSAAKFPINPLNAEGSGGINYIAAGCGGNPFDFRNGSHRYLHPCPSEPVVAPPGFLATLS